MSKHAFFSLGGLFAVAALGMLLIAPKDPEPDTQMSDNTWIGVLVDAACKEANVDQPCPVNSNTERFAVSVDGGNLLDLDDAGDVMARELLREAGLGGNVEVVIIGTREGRDLKVQSMKLPDGETPPVSD